ncbi:unnamed protein product, partial [Adineta ricciae]
MASGGEHYSHDFEEERKSYVLCETKPFQQARERTYLQLTSESYPCRMKMKDAGWFIVRCEDELTTVCLYCKKACRGWSRRYDPSKVHKFLSPKCAFVQFGHSVQTPSSPIVASVSRRHRIRPSSDRMAMVYRRNDSFQQWPPQSIHPPFDVLAESGFFYNGQNTVVECFRCHGQLSITRQDDDPMTAHTNQCDYARHLRNEPLIEPLSIKSSSKSYTYEVDEENDLTIFYLQPICSTTPGILLSAKINLPAEQISETSHTILKQLTVVDHQHRKINWMTSSDGPLVAILEDLATNPIDLTENDSYLSQEDLPSVENSTSTF